MTITTAELAADIAASMGTGSLRERAAAIAVSRPGFLGDGTAAKCLARHTGHERYGLTDITADRDVIEILTKILNPTYGLILYREQIAALTQAITGSDGCGQLWARLLWVDLDTVEDHRDRVVHNRVAPWSYDDAARTWDRVVAAAPYVMSAADTYRLAAKQLADDTVAKLWLGKDA